MVAAVARHSQRLSAHGVLRQAGAFTLLTAAGMLAGAATTALLARHLGPERYGLYALAVSLTTFGAAWFEFGFAIPAARMIALGTSLDLRQRIGAAFLAYAPVGAAFAAALAAFSYVSDPLFGAGTGHLLRVAAVVSCGYPFTFIGLQLAQAARQQAAFAATALVGQGAFLCLVLIAVVGAVDLGAASALVLRGGCILVAGLLFVSYVRPRFVDVRLLLREIGGGVRAYGLSAYVGRVLSISTYNMDVLMVGAFAGSRQVAYYTLAGSITYAAGLPVLGASGALFPRFVHEPTIGRGVLRLACVIGTVMATLASAVAYPLVSRLFGPGYSAVPALVLPLAIATAVRGVTMVYNQFLSAHGRGRDLRDAALVLTAANLVLNFALIPVFGATGAAWASLAALVANLGAHILVYRRSQSQAVEAA